MKVSKLRHRVTLQEKTVLTDELKQQSVVWNDVGTVWASVEPLHGKEYFAARQENAQVSVKITMRYRPGVAAQMRAMFLQNVYEIVSVINIEEKNRTLVLMCEEKV